MIITFESAPDLDRAFRDEALKFCTNVRPIVEKGIHRSEETIVALRRQAKDRKKVFTSDLFLKLHYEIHTLKKRRIFLSFICDQMERLKIKEKKLIVSTREYMEEVYWKNKPVC